MTPLSTGRIRITSSTICISCISVFPANNAAAPNRRSDSVPVFKIDAYPAATGASGGVARIWESLIYSWPALMVSEKTFSGIDNSDVKKITAVVTACMVMLHPLLYWVLAYVLPGKLNYAFKHLD